MGPNGRFYFRAFLVSLVCVVLFHAFTYPAFAQSVFSGDNLPPFLFGSPDFLDSGNPDYLDSGNPDDFNILDVGPTSAELVVSDIAAIRKSLDLIVYFMFPITVSFYLVIKGCLWFYRTFIKSAIE